MNLIRNRALIIAILGLSLTTFVTACVKNESKNEEPQNELVLKQESLLIGNDADGSLHSIQSKSESVHKVIKKEWTFSLDRSSDISINYVRYSNANCFSNDAFIYRFEIQKGNDKPVPMLTKGHSLSVDAGQYVLRAIIENNGQCRDIDFSFKAKINNSKLLSFNSNIKTSLTCSFVKDGNDLIIGEYARIRTMPLNISRISQSNVNHRPVVNDNVLCGRVKRHTVGECYESVVLNHNYKNTLTVQEHKCRDGANAYTRPSTLAVFMDEDDNSLQSEYKCSYRGQRSFYQFSGCTLNYNLGEVLPVQVKNGQPEIDIHIKARELTIGFDFNRNNIDMSRIPGQIYVNLYNAETNQPIFRNSIQMTRAKLLDGDFVMRSEQGETGVLQKLRNTDMRNLYIVVQTSENDFTSGIYHYSLQNLCDNFPFLITRRSANNPQHILRGCNL